MLNREVSADPADPGINQALAAAATQSLPVNLMAWGRLDQAAGLAAGNPDTLLAIDHLGLQQPFQPPPPAQPWADLPKALALAAHDDIRIKISGACTLSHQPFPYNDNWDPVIRIIDRCMCGTDWTRATALLTYEQGVEAFRVTNRLSETDRAALMGDTLQQVYKWPVEGITRGADAHGGCGSSTKIGSASISSAMPAALSDARSASVGIRR